MDVITVEVVFAAPGKQLLRELPLPLGSSARDAALASQLDGDFAGLDLAAAPLAVFGERLSAPEHYALQAGDRVEILRPLLRDPKARRRAKAAQQR